MRNKPKWWALILALILLAGSGVAAYKFHSFGYRGWDKGFNKFGMHGQFDRGYMFDRFDKGGNDDWSHHRGMGYGFEYEMSEEDLSMTPDEYALTVAEKSFGDDVSVKSFEVDEEDLDAYQVYENEKLVQILIIESEEKTLNIMYIK